MKLSPLAAEFYPASYHSAEAEEELVVRPFSIVARDQGETRGETSLATLLSPPPRGVSRVSCARAAPPCARLGPQGAR